MLLYTHTRVCCTRSRLSIMGIIGAELATGKDAIQQLTFKTVQVAAAPVMAAPEAVEAVASTAA